MLTRPVIFNICEAMIIDLTEEESPEVIDLTEEDEDADDEKAVDDGHGDTDIEEEDEDWAERTAAYNRATWEFDEQNAGWTDVNHRDEAVNLIVSNPYKPWKPCLSYMEANGGLPAWQYKEHDAYVEWRQKPGHRPLTPSILATGMDAEPPSLGWYGMTYNSWAPLLNDGLLDNKSLD